ncbi:MAG: hypothetical protein R3C28_16775 [Pirellulaceae bacterium]
MMQAINLLSTFTSDLVLTSMTREDYSSNGATDLQFVSNYNPHLKSDSGQRKVALTLGLQQRPIQTIERFSTTTSGHRQKG